MWSSKSMSFWGGAGSSSNTPKELLKNSNEDFEITDPPNNDITAMEFNPAPGQKNFLIASSYDKTVRLWEVKRNGQTEPQMMLRTKESILDLSWSTDGKKIFMVSNDSRLRGWDLGTLKRQTGKSNEVPLKTCHVISGPYYESCVMTSAWNNNIKIWDFKCKKVADTIRVPKEISSVDVDYDMAVVSTVPGDIYVYNLGSMIKMVRHILPPVPSENVCVSIFRDKNTNVPTGFGLGNRQGRVYSIYNHKPGQLEDTVWFSGDNRDNNRGGVKGKTRDRFSDAINDIKFHPVHGTCAIARSNGTFSYVDMQQKTVLKESERLGQPIQKCCINSDGRLFAYCTTSEMSQVNTTKPTIYINHQCFDDMNPEAREN